MCPPASNSQYYMTTQTFRCTELFLTKRNGAFYSPVFCFAFILYYSQKTLQFFISAAGASEIE